MLEYKGIRDDWLEDFISKNAKKEKLKLYEVKKKKKNQII